MIKMFLVLFLALFSFEAKAQYRLLDVDQVSMQVAKFGCNRDPMIPELECRDWRGRVAINADFRMLEVFYWKNQVHGEGTDAAFKTMGWHFELGLHVSQYLDFFYEHHSRHVLDQPDATHTAYDNSYQYSKFPVEDSYGIRMIFFTNPVKANPLFH